MYRDNYSMCFPKEFIIGTANSAFQSEGAADRDGKSPSMMDHFARTHAGKFVPGVVKAGFAMTTDLPDNGCFFYDNFEAYIDDMKKTGQDAYRLSLAWPRIIPNGVGEVNEAGAAFYDRVIDTLLKAGIEPFVDLLHWDLPMCLHERGGYASDDFPDWFEAYARVCFERWGDRVKLWSTFNEPCVAITSGFVEGRFPPFEKDLEKGLRAGQKLLLAHYRAVKCYREMGLDGKIGAVNAIIPVYPASCSAEDIAAARRQAEVRFDWWAQPMVKGCYPQNLLEECPGYRNAMPEGYAEELRAAFVPVDFLGINYYVTSRSSDDPDALLRSRRVQTFYAQPGLKNDIYPAGLLDSLLYVRDRYDNIPVFITENGLCTPDSGDEETDCQDELRISYLREHFRMIYRAMLAGVDIRGYFYWNDADSYEQLTGYSQRFGLTWIDRNTGRRRWKKSRYYFQTIAQTHMVD